jgi:hypothetical protein
MIGTDIGTIDEVPEATATEIEIGGEVGVRRAKGKDDSFIV